MTPTCNLSQSSRESLDCRESKNEDEIDLYRKALEKWGTDAQVGMATEELAECIVALRHGLRGKASKEEIASEIADVEIMMAQMRIVVGAHIVDRQKSLKLEKLRKLIEEAKTP